MFVHKQYAFLFYRDAACVKYFFYSLGGGGGWVGPGRIMLCVRGGGGVSDAYIWYIYYVNLIQDHFFYEDSSPFRFAKTVQDRYSSFKFDSITSVGNLLRYDIRILQSKCIMRGKM